MVVYRFHSDKATYDSSTRRYTFALDRRVPNATSVAIRKAGYRAARHSGTAAWPGSVLLRSDALHRALRSKHTVEAGSGSHEDASDALCVLEGTGGHLGDFRLHVPGRPQALVRQPNLRSIDFYFTDNGTTLRGDELLSGTDPAPVNALVAQGRVSLWVDTLAAGSYGPRKADGTAATQANDAVASLVPRHPLSAVGAHRDQRHPGDVDGQRQPGPGGRDGRQPRDEHGRADPRGREHLLLPLQGGARRQQHRQEDDRHLPLRQRHRGQPDDRGRPQLGGAHPEVRAPAA